jgi:CBS domain containing-hemolysin-like protein
MDSRNKSKKEIREGLKKLLSPKNFDYSWPIKIGIATFIIGLFLSIGSELILTKSGVMLSLLVIIMLLVISVLFDMLGVAVAACKVEHFTSMASRKISGAKHAIYLVKNAEKASSFASDVIGDICGILSGAVGAAIVIKVALTGDFMAVLFASLISSIIAALTVFGKAVGKNLAISIPEKIVFVASKILYKLNFKIK